MSGFIPPAKPIIGDEEWAAVDRVLRSGMLAQGPEVAAFEQEFAAHFGARPALRRGQLRHLRPAPGAARRRHRPGRRGDRPVVHLRRDRQLGGPRPAPRRSSPTSSPDNFCLDPAAVEAAITERTVGDHAGAPVRPPSRHDALGRSPSEHGLPSSRTPPRRMARARRHAGRRVRRLAMFCFYPTKNMTSVEGGMVTTRRRRASPDAPAAAQPGHGAAVRQRDRRAQRPDDRHPRRHRPGAADASSAAWTEQRQRQRRLPRPTTSTGSSTPPVADGAAHVYHQYTVRVPGDRDAVRRRAARGARRRHRRLLPDPDPPAEPLVHAPARPARDRARRRARCLSLPVHPSVTAADSSASSTLSTLLPPRAAEGYDVAARRPARARVRGMTARGAARGLSPRTAPRQGCPDQAAFLVSQKISAISSIFASSSSALATSLEPLVPLRRRRAWSPR